MTTKSRDTLACIAVVPAAGVGSRMGMDTPKQYLKVAGKTILEHSIDALLADSRLSAVVIALHPDDHYFEQLPLAQDPRVHSVMGGDTRAASVLAALNLLVSRWPTALAVVHDAARPCLSAAELAAVLDQAIAQPAIGALLAMPVRDTMKRACSDNRVEQTVSRENLWHALTPQVFEAKTLQQTLERAAAANIEITDEASAIEWAGGQPQLVAGRLSNLKVTQADDLKFACLWLAQSSKTR